MRLEPKILYFLMQLTIEQLIDLVDPKNPPLLKEWGGAEGLASKLNSHIELVFLINEGIKNISSCCPERILWYQQTS
jgi:hypothetical protein